MTTTEDTPIPDVQPAGLDYSRITVDEQKQLLEARLRNLEAEHFSHASNLAIIEASKASDKDEASKATRVAMVTIEAAHAQVTKQLKALGK